MPIPYTEHKFFYPPRSDSVIPYKDTPILRMWKGFSDSIAQFKLNGTNDQLTIYPDGKIEHWGRHKYKPGTRIPDPNGVPDKMDYVLPREMRDQILDLTPRGKFSIFNVELLHSKTTMVKNTLYFFDTLVWNSEHLLGVEYKERYDIIHGILGDAYFPLDLPKIDGKIYIAENIQPSEWDDAWECAKRSAYCEGLVFKRTGAVSRLQHGNAEKNNGNFMCRSRKGTKNYRH